MQSQDSQAIIDIFKQNRPQTFDDYTVNLEAEGVIINTPSKVAARRVYDFYVRASIYSRMGQYRGRGVELIKNGKVVSKHEGVFE